ncbi:hypothetical protein F503_05079 [Ophiostoma piceae UAMH 11346]|uniref:Uncharacterized protein n=1 Tax=Ophiostoma piceae (strain UAMH 11346) TaxID=1262450 RepID=S3C8Z2_OPHP1|nr:hypothetical protein F503_05079 [Ophiostoma piceae UAMH 11346]
MVGSRALDMAFCEYQPIEASSILVNTTNHTSKATTTIIHFKNPSTMTVTLLDGSPTRQPRHVTASSIKHQASNTNANIEKHHKVVI